MTLIKTDRSVLEREPKRRSERAEYCDSLLDEFIAEGMGCAEVTGYEEHGTMTQVAGCLRTRIAKRESCDVKVATRKGHLFLADGE